MISADELEALARARIEDAGALLREKRLDAAYYVCGYAVELAFKARICRVLDWRNGYPKDRKEFEGYHSFRTHDLNILLRLSGCEAAVKNSELLDWFTIVSEWNPEKRYDSVGTIREEEFEMFFYGCHELVEFLCRR